MKKKTGWIAARKREERDGDCHSSQPLVTYTEPIFQTKIVFKQKNNSHDCFRPSASFFLRPIRTSTSRISRRLSLPFSFSFFTSPENPRLLRGVPLINPMAIPKRRAFPVHRHILHPLLPNRTGLDPAGTQLGDSRQSDGNPLPKRGDYRRVRLQFDDRPVGFARWCLLRELLGSTGRPREPGFRIHRRFRFR